MTCYLAFVRLYYEGIFEDSLKLFQSRKDAEQYLLLLESKHINIDEEYDIIEIELK